METRASYVLVGAFVLLMLAAAALFVVWLGRYQAEEAYVLFNNNNRSRVGGREVAQAPTNAEMLRELLRKNGVPVSSPAAGARAGSG